MPCVSCDAAIPNATTLAAKTATAPGMRVNGAGSRGLARSIAIQAIEPRTTSQMSDCAGPASSRKARHPVWQPRQVGKREQAEREERAHEVSGLIARPNASGHQRREQGEHDECRQFHPRR